MKLKSLHKYTSLLALLALLVFTSCHHKKPPQNDVVDEIAQLDDNIAKNIKKQLDYLTDEKMLDDSTVVFRPGALTDFYKARDYKVAWSGKGVPLKMADTLLSILLHKTYYGFSAVNYHEAKIFSNFRAAAINASRKKDAAHWAETDILLTNAFMKFCKQVHYGILPPDSVSLRKDSTYSDSALVVLMNMVVKHGNTGAMIEAQEPHYAQYHLLKKAEVDYRKQIAANGWDSLPVAYKDTAAFTNMLRNRLTAEGYYDTAKVHRHSQKALTEALKAYQEAHALYVDGVAGKNTIASLNVSKAERLRQLDLNLERYRHLPDSLPSRYVMVNIPAFSLQLWDDDTLVLRSKVIVGEPSKQTPLLNSRITNYVMYPYWVVPFSIITKEMLPAIKNNIDYLQEKNLQVLDRHNNVVDPYELEWTKYSKRYFPYRIRQMTGLDNSLGILKFNFYNKYSVYLHDTNARSLFGKTSRALSHGCVRVQDWKTMAYYLVKNDTARYPVDSLNNWLAQGNKKEVYIPHPLPIYIRYFSNEVNDDGKLIFYEDIYNRDKIMEKQFYATLKKERNLVQG